MIKKAEEKAIAYQLATHGPKIIGGSAILSDDEYNRWNINYDFMNGYEEAEKDLAPLIEAATAVYEAWNGGTMDDVRREMVELGKRIMETKK